jgi:phosphohistidine swiveling domain-containing protein
MRNKNFKVVDPKKRVTVYGTGNTMEKGIPYVVGEQLAVKLVEAGKATLTKPVAPSTAPAAPKK